MLRGGELHQCLSLFHDYEAGKTEQKQSNRELTDKIFFGLGHLGEDPGCA